eukprot:EC790309.1.p1 GENE.EC790309.1~~EC790309.1.p1  ORF type:complete len:125 (+),score=45.19 EC790309.1:146-520(+)
MITDALVLANDSLRLVDAIDDPERYMHLNDSVLNAIESSRDPALAESQAVLRRLRKRQLYKFVDEVIIPPEMTVIFSKVTAIDISTSQSSGVASSQSMSSSSLLSRMGGGGGQLLPEDLIVHDL